MSASSANVQHVYLISSHSPVDSNIQLDLHPSAPRLSGPSNSNNAELLDIIGSELDIYHVNDDCEPVCVVHPRSPAIPEVEARQRAEIALKLSLQKTWKTHKEAQKQVTKAKENRYNSLRDLWHAQRQVIHGTSAYTSVAVAQKSSEKWRAKELEAYKTAQSTGQDIENVGAINRAMRVRMQESFPPMPNYKKNWQKQLAAHKRANAEGKANNQKGTGLRKKTGDQPKLGGQKETDEQRRRRGPPNQPDGQKRSTSGPKIGGNGRAGAGPSQGKITQSNKKALRQQ